MSTGENCVEIVSKKSLFREETLYQVKGDAMWYPSEDAAKKAHDKYKRGQDADKNTTGSGV